MSKHHFCCRDLDRTMCGQSVGVVGSDGERCTLCQAVMGRSPVMCPLGGNCGDPPATQPVGSNDISGVSDLQRGSLDTKRRVSELSRTWWIDDKTPSIEGLTDKDLTDFVYERFEPFRNHVSGEHNCPCWRCTVLRKSGYFPELGFSAGGDDIYVRAIRKALGTIEERCDACEENRSACVCDRCEGCGDLVDECECGWCGECENDPCRCDVCETCDNDPCTCEEMYDCGCFPPCSCGDCWDCHYDEDCDCEECNERAEGDKSRFARWSDKAIWTNYFLNTTIFDRDERLMKACRARDWNYNRVEQKCREGNQAEKDHRARCVEDFRRGNQ